eukprot:611661-Prorocentrum_minimum.AAC.1
MNPPPCPSTDPLCRPNLTASFEPSEDPGVVEVTRMYNYYKKYGHDTASAPHENIPALPASHWSL